MVKMNKLKLAKVNQVTAKEKENTLEFNFGCEETTKASTVEENDEGPRDFRIWLREE